MKKVLIVEDESINAIFLKHMTRMFGFEVCGVTRSGEDAVNKALTMKPDLILMDILLAGEMDGIEAVNRISEHLTAQIVYITASTETSTMERAAATSPLAYLKKPVSEEELEKVLRPLTV